MQVLRTVDDQGERAASPAPTTAARRAQGGGMLDNRARRSQDDRHAGIARGQVRATPSSPDTDVDLRCRHRQRRAAVAVARCPRRLMGMACALKRGSQPARHRSDRRATDRARAPALPGTKLKSSRPFSIDRHHFGVAHAHHQAVTRQEQAHAALGRERKRRARQRTRSGATAAERRAAPRKPLKAALNRRSPDANVNFPPAVYGRAVAAEHWHGFDGEGGSARDASARAKRDGRAAAHSSGSTRASRTSRRTAHAPCAARSTASGRVGTLAKQLAHDLIARHAVGLALEAQQDTMTQHRRRGLL